MWTVQEAKAARVTRLAKQRKATLGKMYKLADAHKNIKSDTSHKRWLENRVAELSAHVSHIESEIKSIGEHHG